MASLGSMLLYWYHWPQRPAHRGGDRRRHDRRALPAPAAWQADAGGRAGDAYLAHSLRRARVQRLDLHRALDRRHRHRHLFGDHRRHRRAARAQHGGANEVAFDIQKRYAAPDEAEADIRSRFEAKEVIIGFGHPVYTVADPRNDVIKGVARRLCAKSGSDRSMFDIADRIEAVMADPRRCSPISIGSAPFHTTARRPDRDVHAAVRHRAYHRLGRACHRAAHRQQDHPPVGKLHRPGKSPFVPLEAHEAKPPPMSSPD